MKLGSPATGADFFGRTQELDDLWRYLEADHISFPGVRRLGKTSILKRLQEQASDHGVLAQWLDVSNIDNAQEFIALLDHTFPEKTIQRFIADMGQRVTDWFSRVRKFNATLPKEVGGGGFGIELDGAAAPAWKKVADTLHERLRGQPLLILIDEFPVMLSRLIQQNQHEAEQLLAWLRIWRQSRDCTTRFVFTGSIGLQSLLERHGLGTTMNDCYTYPLGPLQRAQAADLWRYFAPISDDIP